MAMFLSRPAGFCHPQVCHMGLGVKSHDSSLIQDKALGVSRHYGPCSPSLGSKSRGCLLTRRTRTRLPQKGEIQVASPCDWPWSTVVQGFKYVFMKKEKNPKSILGFHGCTAWSLVKTPQGDAMEN